MTYENELIPQADLRRYRGLTFERKIMSKSFKRVALVTVTALLAGSFSAVTASAVTTTTAG